MHKKLTIGDLTIQHTLVMIGLSVGVVLGRYIWWTIFAKVRGPLGLLAIPLVCPFVCAGLCFILASIGLHAFAVYQTRNVIPTVVLAAGVFIAFQIPMPARPDTPEKRHFLQHRADYEQVVEMARNRTLEPVPSYNLAFFPPQGLEHVSAAGYIYVYRLSSDTGFSVTFNPLERFYHPVVYNERTDTRQPCGGGAVEQKIDDHWYVCQVDWN
jgi:hypothetical protein